VGALTRWAADTIGQAAELAAKSDPRLDATLSAVRDELAWFWAIAAVGSALDGQSITGLDALITILPGGGSLASLAGRGLAQSGGGGRHAAARARAERTAIALGQALAAAVRERAGRLVSAGLLSEPEDAAHLTWDELLTPPDDASAVVDRRRAEHERLTDLSLPSTISATGVDSAIQYSNSRTKEAVAT
jgi:hypothetical protein